MDRLRRVSEAGLSGSVNVLDESREQRGEEGSHSKPLGETPWAQRDESCFEH